LYLYDTLLERLAQGLEHIAAALGPCIQEAHAMVGQRHVAQYRHMPAADQPRIRDGVVGGAPNGRVVTNAVRSPVRPATRWIRVVSMASARVIAGRMAVSGRASIDVPAPGGPSKSTLWSEHLHEFPRYPRGGYRIVMIIPPSWEAVPWKARVPALWHGPGATHCYWPGAAQKTDADPDCARDHSGRLKRHSVSSVSKDFPYTCS